MASFHLAVDQSTSATKALLYDQNGELIAKTSREHAQLYPQPGWVEHDAEEIWQNTLAVVRELAASHPQEFHRAKCLSLTNQRETIAVFERSTGHPLRKAIVWQCRRGDAICQQLTAAGHSERVKQITGLRIDTYFSASKLKWWIENDPELRTMLANGRALIGTIDAYLIYRLTNREVFATDSTNASRTLLYDIKSLRWDPWLCELFNVPARALPEVRDSTANFGSTTFAGLLNHPLPIRGVIGDSQASLLAQQCVHPGMAKVTFGTGSSVLLNIGDQLRFSKNGAVTALAWTYRGRPTYSFEGIISFSAATIAWLRDQLGLIPAARDSAALAASVPDNGGVYLVPAFAGLSAPYWSDSARAAVIGLSAHSTKNHLVRAAEESIAYQLRDVLEMMKADIDLPLRAIHADGGPARDHFLMQFCADLLGLELRAADMPDCSAFGAVLAGMIGDGTLTNFDAITQIPQKRNSFQPAMNPQLVESNYAGWKRAVARVL